MKVRRLTDAGSLAFRDWLVVREPGAMPPAAFLDGPEFTEIVKSIEIDDTQKFQTRFDFGKYLNEVFEDESAINLLSPQNDGIWDWLTVAYFAQLGQKMSKPWHYVVTRKGHSGSLAYRHLARTSFEMYWRHQDASLVMLNIDMSTWGDMSEQLTSRQNVAYHKGFILAANALYLSNGKLRRGAASRVPPRNKRKPGDTKGRIGVGRLALTVRRLCRTYDTHVLGTSEMIGLLPREFEEFRGRV